MLWIIKRNFNGAENCLLNF